MALAKVTYTGDGSNQNYSVTFPYLTSSHVLVYVNGVLKAVTTDYTWTNSTTIRFNSAPANGAVILIKRSSNQSARLTDYQDGSTLTEAQLDADANQMFYMAQEAIDITADNIGLSATTNQWDAVSKRITNVVDPSSAQDAATKNYVDTIATTAIASATSAGVASVNSAGTTQVAAVNSAGATQISLATTQATNASNSASAAATSASNASSSASSASTSASNASTSATNAASSASSASTSATNAANSASAAAASAASISYPASGMVKSTGSAFAQATAGTDFVGLSSTNAHTGGLEYFQPQTLSDSATVTWAVGSGNQIATLAAGGSRTINTSGTPPAGCVYVLKVTPSGAYTQAFGASYFTGLTGITQTATNAKTDVWTFISDGTKLQCIGFRADVGT